MAGWGAVPRSQPLAQACYERAQEHQIPPEGKTRPTEFKSPPGSKNFVNIHKRVKS
jgi:hypothetical protein